MNHECKISVIVNIYNEENFVDQCIQSLLHQTYNNLQIILVDDGSTDKSPEICLDYKRKYPNIVCVIKENEGLVCSRKRGLREATGEYIAFMDGDDWVEPEWYETLFRAAINSGADVIVAGHQEDLCGRCAREANQIPQGIYKGEALEKLVYPQMMNTGAFSHFGIFSYLWDKMFKRELLEDILMQVDERIFIGEDACAVYPALLKAQCIEVLSAYGYHYRQRVNSMVKIRYDRVTERLRLKYLADYLNDCFFRSPFYNILYPQLEQFMLSHIAVRSDGFISEEKDKMVLFPFPSVEYGDRVLIYGAGTFGQHVYRRICEGKQCSVVGWTDEKAKQYQMMGLDVQEISTALHTNYDKIVVAFVDETVSMEKKRYLLDEGIAEKQIAMLQIDDRTRASLLKKIELERKL